MINCPQMLDLATLIQIQTNLSEGSINTSALKTLMVQPLQGLTY